ncbi:type II toxin-antitoxin system RelE/ParE family toxin [Sphingomonas sp. PP-F2F-G114-C0414]|uniref:type II toxin-antitoxin system RelE/ParE family toxin n=1 Tax=Sphingomonas sp. PP-F2F-G114-C0414 TaxID=2135662 RepID=UPI0038576A81
MRAINATFERLSVFHEFGVLRTDLPGGVRSLPTGEHRIFYKVTSDEVLIVRVLHKAVYSTRHL